MVLKDQVRAALIQTGDFIGWKMDITRSKRIYSISTANGQLPSLLCILYMVFASFIEKQSFSTLCIGPGLRNCFGWWDGSQCEANKLGKVKHTILRTEPPCEQAQLGCQRLRNTWPSHLLPSWEPANQWVRCLYICGCHNTTDTGYLLAFSNFL